MKKLLENYIKLLKFNGFYKTFSLIIFIIFPAIFSFFKSDVSTMLEVLIISTNCTFFLMIFDGISAEKYVQLSMVPFKTRDIIKLIYLHTYIILCTSIIFVIVINFINPLGILLEYLTYITALLLSANIVFPYFASTELKLSSSYSDKKTSLVLGSVLITLSILITWFIIRTIIFNTNPSIYFYFMLSLILLNTLTAILTLKKSYKTTFKRVLGYNS
ncbi:hypothetical protein [Clostridium sp. DL1XJH146]